MTDLMTAALVAAPFVGVLIGAFAGHARRESHRLDLLVADFNVEHPRDWDTRELTGGAQ